MSSTDLLTDSFVQPAEAPVESAIASRWHVFGAEGPDRSTKKIDKGTEGVKRSLLSDEVLVATRVVLLMLAAVSIGLVLNLEIGGRLEEGAKQFKELQQLRYDFAAGTAPIGPSLANGKPLPLGTPIGEISIPKLGLNQVVDVGTNSAVLLNGPGYLPSSAFPGSLGTSVIYGRAGAYGGPFGGITHLHKGTDIYVTVQGGSNIVKFEVVDVRHGRQKAPPVGYSGARLTLVTADESFLVPSQAVYVDANIVGTPIYAGNPAVKPKQLASDELPMSIQGSSIPTAVLWLAILSLLMSGASWTWYRRGKAQAWIIFFMPVVAVSLLLANALTQLLPNLT